MFGRRLFPTRPCHCLLQLVTAIYPPVLGQPSFRAPPAVRDAAGAGEIQSGPVGTGLAPGNFGLIVLRIAVVASVLGSSACPADAIRRRRLRHHPCLRSSTIKLASVLPSASLVPHRSRVVPVLLSSWPRRVPTLLRATIWFPVAFCAAPFLPRTARNKRPAAHAQPVVALPICPGAPGGGSGADDLGTHHLWTPQFSCPCQPHRGRAGHHRTVSVHPTPDLHGSLPVRPALSRRQLVLAILPARRSGCGLRPPADVLGGEAAAGAVSRVSTIRLRDREDDPVHILSRDGL